MSPLPLIAEQIPTPRADPTAKYYNRSAPQRRQSSIPAKLPVRAWFGLTPPSAWDPIRVGRSRSFLLLSVVFSSRVDVGAGRIDRRQTDVVLERVRAGRRRIPDVDALVGRKAVRDLNRRISRDDVSPDDVPLNARREDDPVGVSENRIVLDDVVVVRRRDEADAEVASLRRVAVSTQPVPPEPVMACASAQSYAAAGIDTVSIPHRYVVIQLVVRARNHDQSRSAVRRQRHARHARAGGVEQTDALVAKSLDEPGSADDYVVLRVDIDPELVRDCAAAAPGFCIAQACHGEAVQLQRDAGCPERYARCAGDQARDVAYELAVLVDHKRRCDGPADLGGAGGIDGAEKHDKDKPECGRWMQTPHGGLLAESRNRMLESTENGPL
jgi:hypothetical protein